MTKPSFEVFAGVSIPKRAAFGTSGPRDSQYPIDTLEVGQMFLVGITGKSGQSVKSKDGTLTALTLEQDTLRKARQKQSQLAALAKRRGITIESRFITDGEKLHPSFAGRKNFVAVWRADDAAVDATDPTGEPQIEL